MKIAVVTGASGGIGREFVIRLNALKQFDSIWVIARRLERLEELKSELGEVIRPIALDLQKDESIGEYAELLKAEQPEVAALVNASGFGKFETFTNIPLKEHLDMIDLNVRSLTAMTYATLPYMKSGGEIYQLGSLSAFQPVPYISVYGASKAYVLSFTRAVNTELRHTGIKMMAVCPGWVKTEFFNRAVIKDDVITYYNKFFTPRQVVERALNDMKKGKDVSVCGFSIRFQVLLTKLLPHRLVMKIWCKQQKKI